MGANILYQVCVHCKGGPFFSSRAKLTLLPYIKGCRSGMKVTQQISALIIGLKYHSALAMQICLSRI